MRLVFKVYLKVYHQPRHFGSLQGYETPTKNYMNPFFQKTVTDEHQGPSSVDREDSDRGRTDAQRRWCHQNQSQQDKI